MMLSDRGRVRGRREAVEAVCVGKVIQVKVQRKIKVIGGEDSREGFVGCDVAGAWS